MDHNSPVTLRRVALKANMHRQYTVVVIQDLFGTPLVVCRWGRIGTAGQVREYPCATMVEAEEMAARLLEAKKRRGYGTGQGVTVARATRRRKPAANLRRESAGPRQLWLPGICELSSAASPAAIVDTAAAPEQPTSRKPTPALPKHLPDLATVTERRRAPLADADRTRRLNMIIGMMRARGMPVRRGGANGA